ncbi:MAG: hypothetical protein COT43_09585 [Candidatus Marinimicrobia bacterium CG08_land_8_20_14_0_20_45_22]|nr:MAG: hypothetical protein COT43_09585 [Candidatus Marinimicrobia bacterium CG08_land_8_20_14_0_20_45_22]
MQRRSVNFTVSFGLFLAVFGILFLGKDSSENSVLATIRIPHVENRGDATRIADSIRILDGVVSVLINENSEICMIRFDSAKTDIKKVYRQLAIQGINLQPVPAVKLLKGDDNKIVSISIRRASD